jgi:uncharacterized membrane protein (UPF0127 family)
MRRLVVPLVLLTSLSACTGTSATPTAMPISLSPAPTDASSSVTFAGTDAVLHVRVADTDPEREQGLMGVTSMPANEGMAFVFDQSTTARFWMKDTLLPLSIAFVDASGTIVTIREMTPCAADPCETYSADAPYVLAIEANAGWYGANGVAVGDHAVLHAVA